MRRNNGPPGPEDSHLRTEPATSAPTDASDRDRSARVPRGKDAVRGPRGLPAAALPGDETSLTIRLLQCAYL